MRGTEKTIYVYADWKGGTPVPVGRLYAQESRGKEVFSFEYADTWLDHPPMALDPELALYRGRQYMPLDRTQFGVFSDSSPDRWGRLLMQRREAIRAKNAGEKPRKLTESDYLLGVYDEARMGALRVIRQIRCASVRQIRYRKYQPVFPGPSHYLISFRHIL